MIGAIVGAMLHAAVRALPDWPAPMSRRDAEIIRVRDALRRHELRTDDLAWEARGACCPSCFHGATYTEAADQCTRTRAWLIVMLRKRGRAEDLAEAARLLREQSQ
jgi:hypothetical protein